jgi:hypothetical protein
MLPGMKLTNAICSIVLALGFAGTGVLASENNEGWVSIFNHKNLDGWRASENPESFRVENGVLIADGPRAHLFYEGPVGNADLKNFELRLNVKTFPRANSGLFFHTRFQEKDWPRQGYEVQINATHSDRIKTGSIYGARNIMDNAPHKDGEWFELHLIVRDKRVVVKVNGEVVNEFTEPEGARGNRRISRGTVAIQAHDPKSVIHFKNIELRLLPES